LTKYLDSRPLAERAEPDVLAALYDRAADRCCDPNRWPVTRSYLEFEDELHKLNSERQEPIRVPPMSTFRRQMDRVLVVVRRDQRRPDDWQNGRVSTIELRLDATQFKDILAAAGVWHALPEHVRTRHLELAAPIIVVADTRLGRIDGLRFHPSLSGGGEEYA